MFYKNDFILLLLILISSCSYNKGDILGARVGKQWYIERPYGMVLIPDGTFMMGKGDEKVFGGVKKFKRNVSMSGFFMDDAETSNAKYRQFVNWVRDSIIRYKLATMASELSALPENEDRYKEMEGVFAYGYKYVDTTDLNPYQRYMLENYGNIYGDDSDNRYINWDEDLVWNPSDYPDKEYAEVMDSMYLSSAESFNGRRIIDVSKLNYVYYWIDTRKAIRSRSKSKKDFTIKETVSVYPDTTVWIRDFNFSYNDPIHQSYFYHQAYEDYPVVGVSWYQAKAFCHWKTQMKNVYMKRRFNQMSPSFRLPTESEWEYAARGGLENATYPWGGPYAVSDKGCFLANFKPLRGDYAADGSLYTSNVYSYNPNGYGLYNMAGNVSEWTETGYKDEVSNYAVSSVNPMISNVTNRKVIRGGSWKDVAYYLQVSSRDYEYADSIRSYIGFRTVQSYLGTAIE